MLGTTIYQSNREYCEKRPDGKIGIRLKNKFVLKNKYQTPNFDLVLDIIAQVVKSNNKQQTLFSTLDLRYAYSQIPLDKSTREQCNFRLIGGNATVTY